MPKMKTRRSAAKRFELTKGGKIRRRKAWGSHLLSKKTSRRKRSYNVKHEVSPHDVKNVKRMLGIG
ncbi:MAG: 50S ribosomal protein L35 [Candidatus Geothermincolales bacterium]